MPSAASIELPDSKRKASQKCSYASACEEQTHLPLCTHKLYKAQELFKRQGWLRHATF